MDNITSKELENGLGAAFGTEDFEPRPTLVQIERMAANVMQHIETLRNTTEPLRVENNSSPRGFLYATPEAFAGQRASVGRDIVVGTELGPRSGKIVAVHHSRGICVFVPPIGTHNIVEAAQYGYSFKPCHTEDQVRGLKPLEWAWPVKV